MDDHRNSIHSVAGGLFGWEHQPALPAHWRLDSHPDRNRRHPGHPALAWDHVTALVYGVLSRLHGVHPVVRPGELKSTIQKEKCYVVGNHHSSGNPMAARLFWSSRNSKLSTPWRMGAYPDYYRGHPDRIASPGYSVKLPCFDD